jgi:hypothetical protein
MAICTHITQINDMDKVAAYLARVRDAASSHTNSMADAAQQPVRRTKNGNSPK